MANQPVTVVVRLKARPGKEAQVRQELFNLLAPTRAELGCINFDMHEDANDPALFLFHENWTSEERLKQHFDTPHIKRWIKLAEMLLAEPLDLTRWRKVV
jgi:quinol monooxygenase YgiN